MKKLVLLNHQILLLVVILIFCCACSKMRIIDEYDEVKATKRIKTKYNFFKTEERCSPLSSIDQSILKQIDQNKNTSFTFYDAISLNRQVYELEDSIYLFVGNEIFASPIEFQEASEAINVTENTRHIMNADSVLVPVLTGLSIGKKRQFQIRYAVPSSVMHKIMNQDEIKFRYYFGQDMVTALLKGNDLNKLKRVIEY